MATQIEHVQSVIDKTDLYNAANDHYLALKEALNFAERNKNKLWNDLHLAWQQCPIEVHLKQDRQGFATSEITGAGVIE